MKIAILTLTLLPVIIGCSGICPAAAGRAGRPGSAAAG